MKNIRDFNKEINNKIQNQKKIFFLNLKVSSNIIVRY